MDVYDFRRPTTLAREHSRVLELAFETFARQWATQLTAKVRVISQVTSEQVLMQTYNEYAASLPPTTAMVLCAIPDHPSKAVIQFPASAGLFWVDSMLGGHGTVPSGERKFTQIEQALIRRLMDDALEGLHYSLGSVLTYQLGIDSIQYNSQFAQAASTTELMIVGTFEIRVGERSCPATVAIPAQLGDANPTATGDDARELIEQQVAHVPVDVAVQLTALPVLPGRILDLAVGDVLKLPHPQHRPFELAINGQRLGEAALGQNGSRLACVVVTTEENPAP
ncbi:Flagellar motor switch protein FliM [Arthrobacter agilis]|uniref:flagellar motor switch protein FliM n=1 Tax=Arthrobacter agilis TaxID=37921 RepID=UPI000F6C2C88|nr:flagellar motor switch protein FliM [Arthrobacter agilis]VDR31165.1 Flagellar motor switch protein FliM [Arthrobacter agilis]